MSKFVYIPSSSGGATPSGVYEVVPQNRSSRRKSSRNGWKISGNGIPVQQVNPGGITTAADGNPLGNPNFSCIAGPEILPVLDASVPVDVGTAYIFKHRLNSAGVGQSTNRPTAEFAKLKEIQQHYVAFDLYLNEAATTTYEIPTKIVLPVRSVSATAAGVGTGTTIVGGGTFLSSLQAPSDGQYLQMDATNTNNTVTIAFDPTELESNWSGSRITNMYLRYVMWKDDDSEPVPGEGFKLEVVDTTIADSEEIGSYLVQNYQRFATVEQKRLGETNPIPRAKTSFPSYDLHPFTVEDIIGMKAATNRFFVRITPLAGDVTQSTIYFDYVELVVEVVPEYRVVCAVRLVSNARASVAAAGPQWSNTVQWRLPSSSSFAVTLANADAYYLFVREARPADPSDYYRTRLSGVQTVAPMESFGPSLEMLGVLQHRSADEFSELGMKQILTYRVAIADDQAARGTREDYFQYRLSAAHYNFPTGATTGGFWASYRGLAGNELQKVYVGKNAVQRVWLEAGVTYSWIRALAKPSQQALGDIEFQVYNSALVLITTSFAYSTEDWPEFFGPPDLNGWYEALMETLDPITPLVSDWYYIVATSTGTAVQPWLVAAAEPTGMQPYFSYDIPADGFGSGDARIVDYAMTLDCDGTPIAAPVVVVGSNDMDTVSCGITEAPTVELTWTSDGNWDQYVIQKRTLNYNEGDGFSFQSISQAIYALPAGEVHTYVFQAPPWDAQTEYYLVGHRAFDLLEVRSSGSPWIIIPSEGAVLGISQLGVEDGTNVIYAPTANGGPVEIIWTNNTVVEPIALHGVDNYTPLVPVETRGLSFSVTVMIDYLGYCVAPADNSMAGLSTGQRAMDRKAWFTLVELADYGRVWVQFPGGRVEGYIMQIGSMASTPEHGVYAAELNFTRMSGINLGLLGDDE